MNLFGLNGIGETIDDFKYIAITRLRSLFPFSENLFITDDIVYNQLADLEKFYNKRILILGGGPSTAEVNWENIEYDYIFSMNNFFMNPKLENINIDLLAVGAEVNHQDSKFISYINKYNPILMFEIHDRWYNEKNYFDMLYQSYSKISCFHSRIYGKLGVGVRLMMLAIALHASEIYLIGVDGCPCLSVSSGKFVNANHSFEFGKTKLPYMINTDNAYNVYYQQYNTLWNYILNKTELNTKIYNLGEFSDYNFTSIWSKQYFPLTNNILTKIK